MKRLRLCCRWSKYRRWKNGELGFPFYARRSMGRSPDQLRNNSHNQDERSCNRDLTAINFE